MSAIFLNMKERVHQQQPQEIISVYVNYLLKMIDTAITSKKRVVHE
jgi:hypothetical protein